MSASLRLVEGTGPGSRPPLTATPAPRPARPVEREASVPVTLISYALAAGSFLYLLWRGLPYYRLDLAERLHSPLHAALRPNGTVGLLYGYAGTALLLLLLLYSVRKRVPALRGLGVLRRWLNVHVFCGITGPALITLHSSFKFGGIISIGYWSMMTVMASGFVGYYIYRQIPRALSSVTRDEEDLGAELAEMDRVLVDRYGLAPGEIEALRHRAGAERAAALGSLASLTYLMGQDLGLRLGLVRIPLSPRAAKRLGRHEAHRLTALARQRVLLERRRAFLHQSRTLFGYWHAIHKPFTICLYLMMLVHIAVALWFGYATPQP